jgi:4-amino-4-deoxy-L-arabinose transferase-like glycosyltransferase
MLQPLTRWQFVMIIGALIVVQWCIMIMMPLQTMEMTADNLAFPRMISPIEPIEYSNDSAYQGAYRWSLSTGAVRMFGRAMPVAQVLRADIHHGRSVDSPVVLGLTQGQTTQRLMLSSGWRSIHVLVFADNSTGLYREVDWNVDAEPIVSDRRELGVVVRHIQLTDTTWQPSMWPSLLRFLYVGLLWLWVVILCYWRRWPWWCAPILPSVLFATFWFAPLWSEVYIPSAWSILYLGYATLAMFTIPQMRVFGQQWWWGGALVAGVVFLHLGYVWFGSILLIVAWKLHEGVLITPLPMKFSRAEVWGLMGGIVLVAFVARVVWLDDFPVGMFRDEARHGLLSQQIANGSRFVYSSQADLPAGYFYLSALVVDWFGHTAWSIRLVSAVAGFSTVVAVYWMMCDWLGRSWAIYASMFLATLLWHVGLSRIAWPATIGPLLTCIALGALWRGVHRSQWSWGVIAGFATGGMLYFYHSSRLLPILLGVAFVVFVWNNAQSLRAVWPLWGAWLGVSMVVAIPMLNYALSDLQTYMRRVGATSITQYASEQGIPLFYAILENIRNYLGMLVIQGDTNPRHFNLGAPQTNIVEACLMMVGLMRLWQRRDTTGIVISVWLVVGLLPGILSVNAPHALRTVEMIVPLTIVMALGAISVLMFVPRWSPKYVVTVYLLGATVWGSLTYWQWQSNPKTLDAYDARITAVSRLIRAQQNHHPDASVQWYVPKKWAGYDVVRYLLGSNRVAIIDDVQLRIPLSIQGMVVVDVNTELPVEAQVIALPPILKPYESSLKMACIGECETFTWLEVAGR